MCDLRLVSCLEKVFADSAPSYPFYAPEGLRGEEVFFQLSWKNDVSDARTLVNLKIESEISGLIRAACASCRCSIPRFPARTTII